MSNVARVRSHVLTGAFLFVLAATPTRVEGQGNTPGQTPAPGAGRTAAISGVVIDGATERPVAGALVDVIGDDRDRSGSHRRQLTDATGRFVFANLPGGEIPIRASKSGYLDGARASARRIVVRDGEWVADVRLSLWRPAAIEGTVRDEGGDPVVRAFVRVLTKIHVVGQDRFVAGRMVLTDDRGRYRLAGLAPGQYLVQAPLVHAVVPTAPAVDGRPLAYAPTFFPNVKSLDLAISIDVTSGEERGGIDISLETVPAFRLSGIVNGPPESWSGLTLRLVPQGAESLGRGNEISTALVNDGRFTFLNVPAGLYTIDASREVGGLTSAPPLDLFFSEAPLDVARNFRGTSIRGRDVDAGPPGLEFAVSSMGQPSGYWARQVVLVQQDEADLVMTMRHTGTLRGRIVKELAPRTPEPPYEPSRGMQLDPADGSPELGTPQSEARPGDATDQFTIPGLLPGKYLLRLGRGWIAKSISWRGRDYTDAPFDAAETQDFDDVRVVVTNQGAALSGVVRDERGAPARDGRVVIFPAKPDLWANFGLWPSRIRVLSAGSDGRYTISSLPEGEYRVIAVDGSSEAVQLDPEFFLRVERRATLASLSWGQSRNLDLRLQTDVR